MKEQFLNQIGIRTALVSFIIGTLFLLSYLVTKEMEIAIIALYYVIAAAIINLLLLLTISGIVFARKYHLKKYLKTALLMLANIPVVALYFSIFISVSYY